jgi:NitT/TauT family transport system permease protein
MADRDHLGGRDLRPHPGSDAGSHLRSDAGLTAVADVPAEADARGGGELAGLDALAQPTRRAPGAGRRLRRVAAAAWPKLAAAGLGLAVWQAVVWTGWKPDYLLPGPGPVFARLAGDLADGKLLTSAGITLGRAALGYALALVIGTAIGVAVARRRLLRAAVASAITGLQTMPSIAWFPLAILLFRLTEGAILFVVVLGAAPSIANGVLSGVDHVPVLLLKAGRAMGARGLAFYRHVLLPAALPGFVGGLKQGWAFAWRSLMAGELLVILAARPSLGVRLQFDREFSDARGLLATMLAILVVGIVVDSAGFGWVERTIRRHRGLLDDPSTP